MPPVAHGPLPPDQATFLPGAVAVTFCPGPLAHWIGRGENQTCSRRAESRTVFAKEPMSLALWGDLVNGDGELRLGAFCGSSRVLRELCRSKSLRAGPLSNARNHPTSQQGPVT